MIGKKAGEQPHGEFIGLARLAGPDGGGHGQQVVFGEPIAEAVARNEFAHGAASVVAAGNAVEAQNIVEHQAEGAAPEIAALGEQRIEIVAVVFQPKGGIRDAEAHFGRNQAHFEFFQQIQEKRVVTVVADDESGIDPVFAACHIHCYGMGMSASASIGFKQANIVLATQQACRDQPGNTGADNGDSAAVGGARRWFACGSHAIRPCYIRASNLH